MVTRLVSEIHLLSLMLRQYQLLSFALISCMNVRRMVLFVIARKMEIRIPKYIEIVRTSLL